MSNKIRGDQFADPKGIKATGTDGNGILAEGVTVPTNGTKGYAPGCIFSHRAGAADDTLYINNGSATSCLFVALPLSQVALGQLLDKNASTPIQWTAAGTITPALHNGALIMVNNAAGFATTLSAPTGSGAEYTFEIQTTITSIGATFVSTGANIFGGLVQNNDTGSAGLFGAGVVTNAGGCTTITLNGTTTGGRKGDWFKLKDCAAGYYAIIGGLLNASGTEATPFS